MTIRIVKRKNGVYDCYEKRSGRYLFSRISPDNVLSELSNYQCISIVFVDEEIEEAKRNAKNRKD